MMYFILTVTLFLSAIFSGLLLLLFKVDNKNLLKLLLSFSGAYLLAVCVMHLLPEIFSTENPTIGIYILIGFFLQVLLEFFSKGLEHGHSHSVHKTRFPIAIIISLNIHAFIEGMPLTKHFYGSHIETIHALFIGIILHNIPISIVLMSLMLNVNTEKWKAIAWLSLFALMAPLGIIFSNILGNHIEQIADYFNIILALVVGILLHIATTILFESSEKHSFHFIKLIAIILGVGFSLIHF